MEITQNRPLKNYPVAYFWGKNTGFSVKAAQTRAVQWLMKPCQYVSKSILLCHQFKHTNLRQSYEMKNHSPVHRDNIDNNQAFAACLCTHASPSIQRRQSLAGSLKPTALRYRVQIKGRKKNYLSGAVYKHNKTQYFLTVILRF